MNQIVKDKMQREIMVVKNDKLFQNTKRKTGFYHDFEADFEKQILENYEYMVRWKAEENFDYKQPIPYAVVMDENGYVFVYKRWGENSNAWESRLHSKISIWVGGHIEKEEENSQNPIYDTLLREVEEELDVKKDNIKEIEVLWYINNDEDDVNKVHIGIAYLVHLYNSNFDLLDGEIENGEFVSIDELEKMINSGDYDVEAWSKILFNSLKERIKNEARQDRVNNLIK